MDPEVPIECHKCKEIPYDILMLNCNHNLCVKCAAERKKNQTTTHTHIKSSPSSTHKKNYLSCQFCNGKTALDEESVVQLNNIINKKQSHSTLQFLSKQEKQQLAKNGKRVQTPHNTKRQTANLGTQKSELVRSRLMIPTDRKQCELHPEEPVMYFCHSCKCLCFCAECVLTGKHNEHQVKTIKKGYLTYENQFQNAIQRTRKFLRKLHNQKKDVVSGINTSKNLIDNLKRDVQKHFNQVRDVLRLKQQQMIKYLDQKMKDILEQSNGVKKKILQIKIAEQQTFFKKLEGSMKKGEIYMLNLYACQWPDITQFLDNQILTHYDSQITFNESLTDYISKLKDQISQVSLPC